MEEQKIPEKFLPIGTVVILKNGKKPVMITSTCVVATGEVYDKNGKVENTKKVIDYGACFYPEGILQSDRTIAFNHENIEKVCYMGYQTDEQKKFSDDMKLGLEKLKESMQENTNNANTQEVNTNAQENKTSE